MTAKLVYRLDKNAAAGTSHCQSIVSLDENKTHYHLDSFGISGKGLICGMPIGLSKGGTGVLADEIDGTVKLDTAKEGHIAFQ